MTQKMRFCHEVVVDRVKNEIRLDGIAFPYWVEPDPEIEIPSADGVPMAVLRIGIFADSVTYIDEHAKPRVLLEATPEAHSRWAKARAREIVLEGMADVVQWLAEAAAEDRQDAVFEAYQRGLAAGRAHTPPAPASQAEVERQRQYAWELYRDHPLNRWPTMPTTRPQPIDIPVRACDNAEMAHKGHLFTLAGEGQFSCPGRV